jgi:hypothetical protein
MQYECDDNSGLGMFWGTDLDGISFSRDIAEKVCKAYSRTRCKIHPLTNLNKYYAMTIDKCKCK